MPELPEVETVRRGLLSHCQQQSIIKVIIRDRRLRWPIAADFKQRLLGQSIHTVLRRSKYLIFQLDQGFCLLHLGMSGVLQLVSPDLPLKKHDHLDIVLASGEILRLNDPRRFGAAFWCQDLANEPRLSHLGPEPLSDQFNGDSLYSSLRRRSSPLKLVLMNNQVVVGVGNIYAAESLFSVGISPLQAANTVNADACQRLVIAIKKTLNKAIEHGGTTLKDFKNSDGKPGYFQQQLQVYGRAGKACYVCAQTIKMVKLGGRSTFYCPDCQKDKSQSDRVKSTPLNLPLDKGRAK